MGNGTLDLQNVLAYGKADDEHLGPDGEYERGQILCEWGKEFGVEGFVREEATFELTLYLFVFYSSHSKISSCFSATFRMGFSFWMPWI